ncbi:phage tail sheath family protein [Trichothermofontia sp.]
MLASHLHLPGVYREEVFLQPPPDFVTGVPVFVGYADRGPLNVPQRLTLWPQFAQQFGPPVAGSYLADAVHGFFSNGGRLCYVLRLGDWPPLAEALATALDVLGAFPEFDLLCVPDLMRGNPSASQVQRLQQVILENCDRWGHCFAILDALPVTLTTALSQILNQRQQLRGINAALYAPWIKTEQGRVVPPCGHVAGTYAQGDREVGVHHAPANRRLEDVMDLMPNLTDADQTLLNPTDENAGVNCLRALPGRGMRIWGARTVSNDALWRFVNVRRLFITVGRWADRTLADVAFEPNDFRLWIRIERELTAYLESLALQGAFQGQSAQDAFYVKCDEETNPPEIRAAGQVITEIGLAPTIPREFIIVRLIHGETGVVLSSGGSP